MDLLIKNVRIAPGAAPVDIAIAQGDITPENFHSLKSIEALIDRTLSQRA